MTEAQAPPATPVQAASAAVVEAGLGRSYMLVRVGNRWMGIEARMIVEVAVKGVITRIPTAPRHVLGIASLRGGLVPVISVVQLMGTTSAMSTDNGPISPRLVVVATPNYELALVVHEVGGFVIQAPKKSEVPGGKRPAFLVDEIMWDRRTVEVVDVAALTALAAETNALGD
jgi:chemotaxis signal transduction protein